MVTKGELRVRALGTWLLLAGIAAAVAGLVYDVNAMTVPVIRVPVGIAPIEDFSGSGNRSVTLDGVPAVDGARLVGVPPAGLSGQLDGTLTLIAWDATRVEQALARGDTLVEGLAALGVAILLLPVFDAIGRGAPFAAGSGRRLVAAGVLVALAGSLAPQLPAIAGEMVLARTGLDAGPLTGAGSLPLWPPVVGVLLAALGVAFRRGESIARVAEGLV
jgi:hypothetical protein